MMFKKIFQYLFVCFFVLFSASCENENTTEQEFLEVQLEYSVRKITKEDINSIPELKKSINQSIIALDKNTFKTSRSDAQGNEVDFFHDQYAYVVNYEDIKHLTKGDYESYTFGLYSNRYNDYTLENLVFSRLEDGNFETFIATYQLSKSQYDILQGGGYVDLAEFMELRTVKEFNFNELGIQGTSRGEGTVTRIEINPDGSCNVYSTRLGPFGFPVNEVARGVECPFSDHGEGGGGGGDRPSDQEPDEPIDPTGTPVEGPTDRPDPLGGGGGVGTTPVVPCGGSTQGGDGIGGSNGECESPTLPPNPVEEFDNFLESLRQDGIISSWSITDAPLDAQNIESIDILLNKINSVPIGIDNFGEIVQNGTVIDRVVLRNPIGIPSTRIRIKTEPLSNTNTEFKLLEDSLDLIGIQPGFELNKTEESIVEVVDSGLVRIEIRADLNWSFKIFGFGSRLITIPKLFILTVNAGNGQILNADVVNFNVD